MGSGAFTLVMAQVQTLDIRLVNKYILQVNDSASKVERLVNQHSGVKMEQLAFREIAELINCSRTTQVNL